MKSSAKRRVVSVGVLNKALRILDAVQGAASGLSLDEVSKGTGINKSTAYRMLSHLEREAYLMREADGHYVIGTKIVQLAAQVNPHRIIREAARPVLRELLEATRETVNLGVLNGGMVLYVEVLETSYEFRLVSKIGTERPVYATSLGKALAAFAPADEIEPLLDSLSFQPYTPHTITTLAQFRPELDLIRRRGFAVDNEEAVLGARCVAAPVLNSSGEAVAAVSVAGPVTRIPSSKVPTFSVAVMRAAKAISANMGFLDPPRHPTHPVQISSR